MKILNQRQLFKLAIYTLSFLWVHTGLTSIFFAPEIGYQILSNANILGKLADSSIYSGGALDIILGLWLLSGKQLKLCCLTQITVITIYTLLLTFIDASFWLHPFGPITKNLPIIVLILMLMEHENRIDI